MVEDLLRRFEKRRAGLLDQRVARRQELSSGAVDRLDSTLKVRTSKWTVDPVPEALLERRVEMIGGANRSELINGLNAGAKSYVADLWNFSAQDRWSMKRAHKSLEGAAKRSLAYLDPHEGRVRVNPNSPTRLMVTPRPLYVYEAAVQVNGEPVSAGIFDLVTFMQGSGAELIERQGGIFLYLRDVQGHLEARLWADLIGALEEDLSFPRGTVRATVMIDSVPGALEAEEILFEMSHHAAGLSLDPQGYAADHIALFRGPGYPIFPDRETIGLNAPFLRALSLDIIGICHRRGCHAIGASSFVLPSLDPTKMKTEYLEMLSDKEREAVDGHDGTLVVHEDMVNASMVEFNKSMPRAHQLNYLRDDKITAAALVGSPSGPITVESLKSILRTALRSLVAKESKGWVIQGGRVHDRSSLLLAMRLLWQWNQDDRGLITATNLPVTESLITFMLRKEADKMFDPLDQVMKKKVEHAMAYVVELATSPTPPML
jgi:malate synthase